MPIYLTELPSLSAKVFATKEEQIVADSLLAKFRRSVADDDKLKNVLDLYEHSFSDEQVYNFISDAIDDINSGYPRSEYTIVSLQDPSMLINGTIVHAFMAKGFLEIKNSVPINDQGVQVNMYEKGPNFQAIAQNYAQLFESQKAQLKAALCYNNMFVGIPSEFSYM